MDITIQDLTILEPRLGVCRDWALAHDESSQLDDAEVTWAVSARMTAPHLPSLRGGELVLVPPRVAAELGTNFPALLRQATRQGASAVVLTEQDCEGLDGREADAGVLLCWSEALAAETESHINRILTECRSRLYRIGSELERRVAELDPGRSGLESVIRTTVAVSGLAITLVDAKDRLIAKAIPDGAIEASHTPFSGAGLRGELTSGAVLVVGPLRPEQRILARFLINRIKFLVEAALRREEEARPRGSRRIVATEALLHWDAAGLGDQRAAASALGLDPDANFLVAVAKGDNEHALWRALAPLGQVYPAGCSKGTRNVLVAVNSHIPTAGVASLVQDIKRRWEREHGKTGAALALSALSSGVSGVPFAFREAAFVASLQQGAISHRAASFESVNDVGAFRLLYQLKDSRELPLFVSQVLGGLRARDQRGALRATLRAFLENGGSHADASQQLGIHRNTLAYRLHRISDIIGWDVAEPRTWMALHLALSAADMLEAFDDEA